MAQARQKNAGVFRAGRRVCRRWFAGWRVVHHSGQSIRALITPVSPSTLSGTTRHPVACCAAATIAADLAGTRPAPGFAPMPGFWSDQHGLRLQSAGAPALGDGLRILEGSPDRIGEAPLLVEYLRAGRAVGILGIGMAPAEMARATARLEGALKSEFAA